MTWFFFHIPKTGGTSFKRVLERWFTTRQDDAQSPEDLRELERVRPADLCIHGHFSGLLQSSGNALLARYPWIAGNPEAPVFTLLRDPVEQAVSLYYHERQAGRASGALMDFLKAPHAFAAARALEITQASEIEPALRSFRFVGVTDELQATIDRFAGLIGKPRFEAPHERVAARDEQMSALSPAERRRIEDLYPIESELYARARAFVMGGADIPWSRELQFDYLRSRPAVRAEVAPPAPATGAAAILSFRCHGEDGVTRARFDCREKIGVSFTFDVRDASVPVEPAIRVTRLGHAVFVVAYVPEEGAPSVFGAGRHEATTWIPGNLLNPGPFELFASLARPSPVHRHDQLADPLILDIVEHDAGPVTARGGWTTPFPGGVRPLLKWTSS